MKLTETLRYSGGCVFGYAQNGSGDAEVLATHALVIEVVCHFGGPKYILRIHTVVKLNSDQLKEILLHALVAVCNAGGTTISCVCDNCNTNVAVYRKLGGPGKSFIDSYDFLVYDYVHSFKNIRNNWITEHIKELSFTKDLKKKLHGGVILRQCTTKIVKTAFVLQSSHTQLCTPSLCRDSVPFVCQIFNDKTVAALSTVQNKL